MMDAFLAEHYGTNKTASAPQEDLEKQATAELFMKLAGEANIDLKSMTAEKVAELYNSWNDKRAAAAAPAAPAAAPVDAAKLAADKDEDDKKKKLEAAEKEHTEKKASQEKIAEADFLGRVMAHSFEQEKRKIAEAQKAAEFPPKKEDKGDEKKDEKKDGDKDEKKDEKKGGFPAALFGKKEASAIDTLAVARAGEMATAANLDGAEAVAKIAAAFTLNLVKESTKVASAPDTASAIDVRALELLELAGYEVTWA